MERLAIRCADGAVLAATRRSPAGPERGATVVIAPAILVRERFYARFAEHLAGQGFTAITFANRGQGASRQAMPTGRRPRLRDWGELDLPAVIAHARGMRPHDRLFVVGHSMGGQLAAFSPAVHELEGIVTVASTEAWWGHWPRPDRYGILAFYLAVPFVGRALRTLPASRVGLGPDLDTDVLRTWARWGRDPGYFLGRFGIPTEMARYSGRILAWSFTDDRLASRRSVDALHAHFDCARINRRHVQPAEVGRQGIGHFGFFQRAVGEPLWDETVAFLEGQAPSR
ncbi:MAG: alpha/beta fold hydrolase [Proteobacteria bacterium]|nr:alpha/beta fold hydrolase [Pseudomonadota bacterium]MCP4917279.1 alpha/beta fold hydrolase [Pseudomonadota bacterium]